jgi:hypothetical protein
MRGGVLRDGRYEIYNATMVDLVRTAYNVAADDVLLLSRALERDVQPLLGLTNAWGIEGR